MALPSLANPLDTMLLPSPLAEMVVEVLGRRCRMEELVGAEVLVCDGYGVRSVLGRSFWSRLGLSGCDSTSKSGLG